MIKVAINGFGRIGRSTFKIAVEKFSDQLEVVAVNDLTEAKTLAHLLKYDSNYGVWNKEVNHNANSIIVDQKPYKVYQEKEPDKLPWKDLGVDVVIESTGRFTSYEGASLHLQAGAKKVVISAPTKGDPSAGSGQEVKTFLLGVNADKYAGENIISNSSCTTNCVAPVAAVVEEKFGIVKAMMTTIHAYTADQNLQDGPHRDLRRARAAAANIVPTSTGAAISTAHVIPDLEGKFDGTAIRVPVAVGSISDFTFLLKKKVTVDEVNQAFKEASDSKQYQGILAVTEDPIVSSDIVGRSESAIVDLSLTKVVDGDMVEVFAWYDNEYGYSYRLIEQVINVGNTSS